MKYFSAKDPPPQPSLPVRAGLWGPVGLHKSGPPPPSRRGGRPKPWFLRIFHRFFSQGMAIYQGEVTELPKKLAKSALYLCCNYSAFWAKCQLFVPKLCTPPQPGQNRAKQGQNRAFLGIFRAFLGPFRAGSVTILSSFCPNFFVDSARPPQKARPAPSRAGPTLAILAVWWVRLLWLFANPGRWLQRPYQCPGLVTLAKPSRQFLCAFTSHNWPCHPAFGYFSYISAANPGRFRQSRPAAPAPQTSPGFGHPGQTQPPVSVRFSQSRPASPPHFWLF